MTLVNGGYDCCPTSNYQSKYGHVLHRVGWYIDIYNLWTNKFPIEKLVPAEIKNCKLA